jgi:hypothetical protein
MYDFDKDVQRAKAQFREYTQQLIDAVKRDKSIPYLRRKRLVWLMCEKYMRTFDYEYKPERSQLDRLALYVLLAPVEERTG